MGLILKHRLQQLIMFCFFTHLLQHLTWTLPCDAPRSSLGLTTPAAIIVLIFIGLFIDWPMTAQRYLRQVVGCPCSNRPETYEFPICSHVALDSNLVRHHRRFRNPKDIEGQASPVLLDNIKLVDYQSDFSIIISIHNQERVISRNLAAIMNLTQGLWQLVVVFDDCTDASLTKSRKVVADHTSLYSELYQHMHQHDNMMGINPGKWECFVHLALKQGIGEDLDRSHHLTNNSSDPNTQGGTIMPVSFHSVLTQVSFIQQSSSVWETTSDNIGMAYSSPSKYFILVQSDIWILSPGWNLVMSLPAEIFVDVFSVSARCAHSFSFNKKFQNKGRCGVDVADGLLPENITRFSHEVYLLGTVNRGPLLFRADRIIALGLLDEDNFIQGDDDHDLMARALVKFKWRAAGYFAINFVSPTLDGTTRSTSIQESSTRDDTFKHDRRNRMNNDVTDGRLKAASLLVTEEIRQVSDNNIHYCENFWHNRIMNTLACESTTNINIVDVG